MQGLWVDEDGRLDRNDQPRLRYCCGSESMMASALPDTGRTRSGQQWAAPVL